MNQNIVTLQLTVPALEKLFEGDPEIVLKLRQAAVSEFTRRKIGELLEKSAKADVEAAVAKHVGTITNAGTYSQQIKLQKPILDMIQTETQKTLDAHTKAIERLIQEMVTKATQTQTEALDEKVKKEVERRVNAEVAARVTTEVKAKMQDIMKAAQF